MDPVDLAAARRHDPVRIALLETVHTDPPRIGGFLVTLQLAAAVLDYHLRRRDADLLGYLMVDAIAVLRQRRAPASAADRARQLGMRKGVYLELRGHLLQVLRRVLTEGSMLREPKTPGSRQARTCTVRVLRESAAECERFTTPRPDGVSRDREGADLESSEAMAADAQA
ncbi:MAG: hypothetical protein MK141_14500 [Pseudoxanthomonas sp.]|uniref:hypothetical protein n=1 Tax=Pseudoxanthomonas sp. TaxID=1871049 RepID=UPI00258AAAD4|nr:hypothetical protein [Pseudoxanthomonas sp.]MCH2092770.1 hypothetical protein [Pseudoxanthomonas sp.]